LLAGRRQREGRVEMTGSTQHRTKLGRAFASMLTGCPDTVAAYAACLEASSADGDVRQGACQQQFAAMKECFRRTAVAAVKR
jgi:hypothetical protein